ncbi:hypothetical protein EMCRGX_G025729, partial [Ephydatia muelleri]
YGGAEEWSGGRKVCQGDHARHRVFQDDGSEESVSYPLAWVELNIDGVPITVEAALSNTLPSPVLLGRDVPELSSLLNPGEMRIALRKDDAMVVTRAGAQGEAPTTPEEPQVTNEAREKVSVTEIEGQAEEKDKTMEDADETLKVLRLLARKGDPRFIWKNSLLYRKERRKELGEKEVEQLILPRQCRKVVLKLGHEAPLAGHMGRNKTLCRVLQRFYWPNINGDVAEWCRSCPNCQKTHNRKTPPVPLIPLPIMTEPFSRIAMDIVGPLLRSRRGHRFILVVCDYATRYPEAIPLRSCKAETVAEELLKMFARVGIPREILTDKGSNFTSRLLGELYAMLKVHPIRTTPYHPQTDGLVERFNQTLKAMLRRTVDQEGKDWDRLIPFLLFVYREVPQVSTGFSPFELLYGRMVRGPLDVVKEAWESEQAEQSGVEESVVSYVLSIQEKLNQMAGLVRANMEKAQATQKHWYDRKSRERALNEGDKVLVLLPTSNDKLLAQWQGPYVVRRKVNDVNYKIDLGSRKRKRFRLFHINMLRRWYETNSFVEEEAEEVDTDEEAEPDLPSWGPTEEAEQQCEYEVSDHLTEEQKSSLQQLLAAFKDTLQNKPGRTQVTEHSLHTGGERPVRLRPYRLPYVYRRTVEKELNEMLKEGVISRSTSEWAAPIVLITIKKEELRFCVDYRRLNAISSMDSYPMPRMDEMIDQL